MNTKGFMLFPLAIILGLAFLALLIVGVVVLFVKLRAKAWWIVGPLLLVPVLMAGLVLPIRAFAPTRSDRVVMPPSYPPPAYRGQDTSEDSEDNSARARKKDQSHYNEDGSTHADSSDMGSASKPPMPARPQAVGLNFGVRLLPVLGLLIASVVLLFHKFGAKAWWIVGPLVLVPVLIAGLWHFVNAFGMPMPGRSYKASYSRSTNTSSRSRTVTVTRSGGAAAKVTIAQGSASGDRFSETFLADVYPSPSQAAEALALDVAKSFHDSLYGMEPDDSRRPAAARPEMPPIPTSELPDILVTGQADTATLEIVAEAFRRKAMARRVSVAKAGATSRATSAPAATNERILCAVRVDGKDAGTVQIVLESPRRQIIRSTRFVSKPWAANFAQYAASADKPVVWAGSGAVASFEQAQADAFDQAARQLAPYVRSVMMPSYDIDDQAAREGILAELRKGKLILDRFPQRFDRSYGKLWREQMLIDASPQAIMPLAKAIRTQTIERRLAARQSWWNLFASLGGMAVLIFAVYLVLNAATKGYYTWVLRFIAAGAVLTAVAVVVLMG